MTFDLEKTIQYWHEGAKYDLGVADAMFKSKKYPYSLFMGHLALEKLLMSFADISIRANQTELPHAKALKVSLSADSLPKAGTSVNWP